MYEDGIGWEKKKKDDPDEKCMKDEECDICKKERRARAAVARSNKDERFEQQPFSCAPYIHQLNEPKYAAMMQRAMKFAETNMRSINFVTAHDYPLHRDDQAALLFLTLLLSLLLLLLLLLLASAPRPQRSPTRFSAVR